MAVAVTMAVTVALMVRGMGIIVGGAFVAVAVTVSVIVSVTVASAPVLFSPVMTVLMRTSGVNVAGDVSVAVNVVVITPLGATVGFG